MKEVVLDAKGEVAFEILYPDPPEARKVSEFLTTKNDVSLPYKNLLAGEFIIHEYIARTDRRKHRQIVDEERRRARWERKK